VFHFQFHRITVCYGCRERVAEDVYHTALAGLDFGAGLSYAAETSSTSAAHDKAVPNFGLDLDATADVLL
jgi:hypothetical protein